MRLSICPGLSLAHHCCESHDRASLKSLPAYCHVPHTRAPRLQPLVEPTKHDSAITRAIRTCSVVTPADIRQDGMLVAKSCSGSPLETSIPAERHMYSASRLRAQQACQARTGPCTQNVLTGPADRSRLVRTGMVRTGQEAKSGDRPQ